MNLIFLLILTTFINICAYSQSVDTLREARSSEWWWIIGSKNVAFKSRNLRATEIENEIRDLESREIEAMTNQDTLTLIRLWAKDFTLDESKNELVQNKTGLITYLSLRRMIEAITPMDKNTVFSSGEEAYQEIRDGWRLESGSREFFHVWTKKDGIWKLTTKTTSPSGRGE